MPCHAFGLAVENPKNRLLPLQADKDHLPSSFFSVPQWLTFNLFLWLVFLLTKTKPKKVNLFW